VKTKTTKLSFSERKKKTATLITMTTAEGCVWLQREIAIPAKKRGCHLITDEFLKLVPEIEQIQIGIANVHS
jgi:hypothetical protein